MSNPLVSVIIPVFNGDSFLIEALESIKNQNYEPLEIIVVDDGSTDRSADIAKSDPRVRYFYQSNKGPGPAKNLGINNAKGDYISFLDHDDLWTRNIISEFMKVFIENPKVEIVHGLVQQLSYNEERQSFTPEGEPHWHVNLGSALYRRCVFPKIGLFDSDFHPSKFIGDDLDWFMRAWELRIIKERLSKISLLRRKHKNNMTNNYSKVQQGLVRVFYKHLKRVNNNPNLKEIKSNAVDYFGYLPFADLSSELS